jgi:hypothetical protein
MKMKHIGCLCVTTAVLLGACKDAGAQLPSDFPLLNISNSGGAAPGNFIGNIGGRTADGTKLYYIVLDNTGTNALFASKTNTLYRFVTPQGFDAVYDSAGFRFKDETLSVVDTSTTSGYTLDTHDLKLLPNGHTLLFGTETVPMDMSQLVPGGRLDASVVGGVIQEIDALKHVVFEWHTLDHIPITNSFFDLTQRTIDYAHINAVTLDPTDNNLLASLRTTSEIVKINRRTGQVMWRLGGKANQFTYIGEHPENAPYYTVGQHDVHRLANGNLLFFDNGNISGGGLTPSDRTYSRAVEYQLDEANLTATLVWEFRRAPDISVPCTGSLKRFANGNTLIDWGCAVPTSGTIVTEVSPAGDVVFEMNHRQTGSISSVTIGGGLTKQLWNTPDLTRSATYQNIQSGQTYDSAETGVSVTVNTLSAASENTLVVQRHLDAVRFPQFSGDAPQVLMEHVTLSSSNIDDFEGELSLALPNNSYVFDTPLIHDPAQLVIYHRPTPSQGQFSALPTTYDSVSQDLRVTTTQMGEFIFAYPDLSQIPLVPLIVCPPDQSTVNQRQAVSLDWKPSGLVDSYDLQLATDADFTNLVLNTNGLACSMCTLQTVLPATQYFWRVRVVNDGGTSDWASASFTTVPQILQVTAPNGGEVWQRFNTYSIRWVDNLAENVAIDLYKGGVSNRTMTTSTASSGLFQWTVGAAMPLTPGSDYSIRVRSRTNSAVFDFSDQYFSIVDAPVLNTNSVTVLPDGRVTFNLTAPGAASATVLGSTNLSTWEVLQALAVTNGAAVFTEDTSTNCPHRFYRVRVP